MSVSSSVFLRLPLLNQAWNITSFETKEQNVDLPFIVDIPCLSILLNTIVCTLFIGKLTSSPRRYVFLRISPIFQTFPISYWIWIIKQLDEMCLQYKTSLWIVYHNNRFCTVYEVYVHSTHEFRGYLIFSTLFSYRDRQKKWDRLPVYVPTLLNTLGTFQI